MDVSQLQNRDYTVIVDKSGSMSIADCPNGKSRWAYAQESVLGLANKCAEFDPDGITVYTFSSNFKRYDNCTPAKVGDVWKENDPMGGTELHLVLNDAFNNYFLRKKAGTAKANGELILVITDGEPNDRKAVEQSIISASKQMDRDEELAVSFIQIGSDAGATAFLKHLDDGLQAKGAKFDIVDTVTAEQAENQPLIETLMNAITD